MIKVLVVDDSSRMRRMKSELLDSALDIRVVGTAVDFVSKWWKED